MSQKPVILCVDDEKSVLNTLRQQLKDDLNGDFTIEIAESGDEALEILEELQDENTQIATIISDQIMPGIKSNRNRETLNFIHKNYCFQSFTLKKGDSAHLITWLIYL